MAGQQRVLDVILRLSSICPFLSFSLFLSLSLSLPPSLTLGLSLPISLPADPARASVDLQSTSSSRLISHHPLGEQRVLAPCGFQSPRLPVPLPPLSRTEASRTGPSDSSPLSRGCGHARARARRIGSVDACHLLRHGHASLIRRSRRHTRHHSPLIRATRAAAGRFRPKLLGSGKNEGGEP
jgi:hypothetical protein